MLHKAYFYISSNGASSSMKKDNQSFKIINIKKKLGKYAVVLKQQRYVYPTKADHIVTGTWIRPEGRVIAPENPAQKGKVLDWPVILPRGWAKRGLERLWPDTNWMQAFRSG